MTSTEPTPFNDALAIAAQHQELQMWRAAQLVKSHVSVRKGRAEVLDCLGLTDVVRPEPAGSTVS
ncbi:MAG TPA: hypothetical protein VNA12_06540 [Mycobacteriales bacterium]|nr:hypothetical protein [Mycobacteriales bacterium]